MPNGEGRDRRQRQRGDEWADRAERVADDFTRHPVRKALKWLGILFLIILALGAFTRVTGFLGLWADEAQRIVSPDNVREQFTKVQEDWQRLQESADKVCQAQGSTEGGRTAPTFVEDPLIAMKNTYYSARSDYNRRMNNIFEGRKVGPPGYPRNVPVIEATVKPKGDWCEVSQKLREIHE